MFMYESKAYLDEKILFGKVTRLLYSSVESVVVQWCDCLTLQSEQAGGVGSTPCRALPLKRHDAGLQTRLALQYFSYPST